MDKIIVIGIDNKPREVSQERLEVIVKAEPEQRDKMLNELPEADLTNGVEPKRLEPIDLVEPHVYSKVEPCVLPPRTVQKFDGYKKRNRGNKW